MGNWTPDLPDFHRDALSIRYNYYSFHLSRYGELNPRPSRFSSGCFINTLQLLFFPPEPLWGIEPQTSSLPRKCSTTELQRLITVASWPLSAEYDLSSVSSNLATFYERKTGLEPATWSLEGYRSTKWATSANWFENLMIWQFTNSRNYILQRTYNYQITKLVNYQIVLWAE